MSASLMIAAGYLDLPQAHKLALMKICDSADDGNRLGFPGVEAIRLWTGTKKSQTYDLLADLQEWGLLMQVEAAHRGKRAVYKVFPNPGDEVFSLSHKQRKACPGADKFSGAPVIPTADEVKERVIAMDATKGSWNGSGAPDPLRKGPASRNHSASADQGEGTKGPASRNHSEGSGQPDALSAERVRPDSGKGPAVRAEGSGQPDPFGLDLPPNQTSEDQNLSGASLRDAPADESDVVGGGFELCSPGSDDGRRLAVVKGGAAPKGDDRPPEVAEAVRLAHGIVTAYMTWWAADRKVDQVPNAKRTFNALVGAAKTKSGARYVTLALLEGWTIDQVKLALAWWAEGRITGHRPRSAWPSANEWSGALVMVKGGDAGGPTASGQQGPRNAHRSSKADELAADWMSAAQSAASV
jgi:hypothetical protein